MTHFTQMTNFTPVYPSLLWLFDAIWIYIVNIKNQNFKKRENESAISIFYRTDQILCGVEKLLCCS